MMANTILLSKNGDEPIKNKIAIHPTQKEGINPVKITEDASIKPIEQLVSKIQEATD